MESSGDNDLAKEGELTYVAMLDLHLMETIHSWETLRTRGGHDADRGGRGPFGIGYHGIALVEWKCSPLMVIHPSIIVPCLPFP